MTFITSLVIGVTTFAVHDLYGQPNNYIHSCNNPETFHELHIRVDEKLKNSSSNYRYIGTINQLDKKAVTGKILLNISIEQRDFAIEIGSHFKVFAKIIKHQPSKNPYQFDYGKYLTLKSIPAKAYVPSQDIKILRVEKNISHFAASLRNKIFENLRRNGFGKDELNIAMALILGQQQDISKEILQDYQFAGAVHILSVSGLHVGFILIFINFLLSRIPKNKAGNTIRFCCVIIGLWLFAILAGLAPSVIRSATMFSFLAFGLYLKRDSNIFHVLLASMLCILIIEPSFLFDVGFQLSYVSLFFILWLQPIFSKLWTPKNKITMYFWNLLTVSFAAQIGAFPLSIYYFHQFPGLFFVTNLVILPFVGLIMGLGVLVMLLAAFDFTPELLLFLLEKSIYFLNITVGYIASFEQFLFKEVPLGIVSMLMLYFIIASIFLWFEKPGFGKLALVCFGIILFQTISIWAKWSNATATEMIVFQQRKETLIAKKMQSDIAFYTSNKNVKSLDENNLVKSYLLENAHLEKTFAKLENTIYFKDKRILIIDSIGIYPENVSPDITILSNSPKINLERFLKKQKTSIIIADGSNFKSYVTRWKETCLKQKIPFHATYEKGFYKIE